MNLPIAPIHPENKMPLTEKFVQLIEEMSPAIPLIACMMWGVALVLISFPLNLATFQAGSKSLGWINEFNWSSTFSFFIPFSLFFSFSTLTAIPQVITTLANGQMIRGADGELADADGRAASQARHHAPFGHREGVGDIDGERDEGEQREPAREQRPHQHANETDLDEGRDHAEEQVGQQVLDAFRAALDRAGQAAGLALEMKAQR